MDIFWNHTLALSDNEFKFSCFTLPPMQHHSFLTLSYPIGTFVDFTLSNARPFYSSMGKPLSRKGLTTTSSKNSSSPFLTLSCPIGTFVDFTLSNARPFYLSTGNPLGRKGFTTTSCKISSSPFLTLSCPIGTFVDFTLSNTRRFYSSMGNLLDRKGLRTKTFVFSYIYLLFSMKLV